MRKENYEPRIQTTRDIIQATSRASYDTATTSRQTCLRAEYALQVVKNRQNAKSMLCDDDVGYIQCVG